MMFTETEALELAKRVRLDMYSRQPLEDVYVLQWQKQMMDDDEFLKIFDETVLAPSAFFRLFRQPSVLYYGLDPDDREFNVAVWFEPSRFGAFAGVWMHPNYRHSPGVFQRVQAGYALGFARFDLLAGLTTQEELLVTHEKMGYEVTCRLPWKMNGRGVWLLHYNKDSFLGSTMNPFRPRGNKRRENKHGSAEASV